MAIHTNLPIYKVAYDLLDVVTELVKNMPREFKRSIGGKVSDECVEIVTLIFRGKLRPGQNAALNGFNRTPSSVRTATTSLTRQAADLYRAICQGDRTDQQRRQAG